MSQEADARVSALRAAWEAPAASQTPMHWFSLRRAKQLSSVQEHGADGDTSSMAPQEGEDQVRFLGMWLLSAVHLPGAAPELLSPHSSCRWMTSLTPALTWI